MPRVYLSLGSNVRPEANLALGVRELTREFGAMTLSPVYRNKAVGFVGDDFLNLVAGFDTRRHVPTISRIIEAIHRTAGRRRGEERFSSRTLDIDLLTYGNRVTKGPPVSLPRADILKYAFVLKPLADIAGNERHPVDGRTYGRLWHDYDGDGGLHEVTIDLHSMSASGKR